MSWLVAAAKRLLQLVLLIVGCTFLVFMIQAASGRDPARAILGQRATPEQVDALRAQLGLDQPLIVQYGRFVGNLLHGDFGISYYSGGPIGDLLAARLGVTGLLLAFAFLFSLLISIPLTMGAVRRPGGIVDGAVRAFTLAGTVMPAFWLGILLILLIALPTGWFPVSGFGSSPGEHVRAVILPALTMAIGLAPVQIRTLRTSWLHSMGSPYVEAARSRGAGQSRLMFAHALPNSVAPLIAIIAVQAGWSIFLAVIVENTFRLPGLGQGLVLAANQSDLPVVNATTLVLALVVVTMSLVAEWVSDLFNPKLRSTR
jgi:peptide/nickel transport system permease protein